MDYVYWLCAFSGCGCIDYWYVRRSGGCFLPADTEGMYESTGNHRPYGSGVIVRGTVTLFYL